MAAKGTKGKKKKDSNYQNEVFRPQNLPFMYFGDLGMERLPITRASLPSLASHAWLTPIMCRLTPSRIMAVLGLQWYEEDTTEYNVNRLEESWEAEKKARGLEKASLFRAVIHAIKHRIIISLVIVLCTLSFSFLGSAGILRLLLEHVSEANSDTVKGACIVGGLIACEICRSLTFSLAWAFNYWNGSRVRGAAMGLLYKKVLKLKCLREKKIGEIVNLCSYDGQRFFEALANGPFIIGGPVIFVAGSIYLFFLLGQWAWVGCVTYIFFIALLNFFAKGMAYFRTRATTLTGERVSLMTEVLSCIKLIKINVWEKAFTKRITVKRQEEQVALECALFLQSMTSSLSPMIPIFASIFMFLSYILSGNRLTGAQAFTLISVLYSMSFALTLMIYGIRTLLDAKISAQRYQEVLMLEEIEPKPPPGEDGCAIVFDGGCFSWDEEMDEEEEEEDELLLSLTATELAELRAKKPLHNGQAPEERRKSTKSQATWRLADISLTLKKGQLIGICGMKGSGKSSLLSAILGRMTTLEGSVEVGGKVAYSSQEPWIFNGNARDNILFGQTMDKDRYEAVVQACGLAKDFDTFSAGDRVEIGDRGLTLSGGQKQRVSIARAAYSESDIYLFDDPLSAQDVQIARHIFSHCFKRLLLGKTVVFVTHHLEYLSNCDYVVLMQHGRVVEQGTHAQLMSARMEYADLQELYQSKYKEIQRERLKSHAEDRADRMPQRGFSRHSKKLLTKQLSRMSTREYQHQFSAMSNSSGAFPSDYEYVDIDDLVDAEELSECKVPATVVRTYLKAAGGYCVIVLALITFFVSIAVQAGANGWLSYWLSQEAAMYSAQNHGAAANTSTSTLVDAVQDGDKGSNASSGSYNTGAREALALAYNSTGAWTGDNGNGTELGPGLESHTHTNALVYGMIAIAMIVTMAFREVLFIKIILRAASCLHRGMLEKLLRCPMKFFDTTPLGIILNRFSADLDELDVRFPTNCGLFLQNIMMVTLALVVICLMFPWVLLAVLPLALVFTVLAYKYAPILQRLKYLDSITRSPFLSHLAASVEGLATIHVFQQTNCFVRQFCEMVDRNMVPFFLFYSGNRWLALFLDLMTVTVMGITGFLIIFTLTTENATQAGLALSFAIQITSLLQYTLRLSIETWSRFTSVHRIQDYIENLPEEGSIAGERQDVDDHWPAHGFITFHKYRMRYNEGLPFALKGISAQIQARERIGVVGSSGSGKSSLGMALLRLVEASSGAILVDGKNIRDVKLETLRSKIAILAQEPVLFTGTIRYNLDPTGRCTSEATMWEVLEKCHIRDKIEEVEDKLDAMVGESGRNFSLGEKQLLCLARILLHNCKILILDEATASVDTRTESLVQKSVNDNFQDCTIFIIAHRLNTIMNCDRVLVMEDGKVVELDSPMQLLRRPQSRLKTMWEALQDQPRMDSDNNDSDDVITPRLPPDLDPESLTQYVTQ